MVYPLCRIQVRVKRNLKLQTTGSLKYTLGICLGCGYPYFANFLTRVANFLDQLQQSLFCPTLLYRVPFYSVLKVCLYFAEFTIFIHIFYYFIVLARLYMMVQVAEFSCAFPCFAKFVINTPTLLNVRLLCLCLSQFYYICLTFHQHATVVPILLNGNAQTPILRSAF